MYRVYYGNEIVHDPYSDDQIIYNASCTGGLNDKGSFNFTISPKHPLYKKMKKRGQEIRLENDGVILFLGYIQEIELSFYNEQEISCIGCLDYLNDVLLRPYYTSTSGENSGGRLKAPTTASGLFDWYIEQYNKKASHTLRVGKNQADALTKIEWLDRSNDQRPTVGAEIEEKFVSAMGGYLYIRYEGNVRYLDYVSDVSELNTQIIDFGVNLMSYTHKESTENLYTAILPIGGVLTDEDGNEIGDGPGGQVTLASIPDGYYNGFYKEGDVLINNNAVNTYGYREYLYMEGESLDGKELVSNAAPVLKKKSTVDTTIEAKAVDLSLFMEGYKHLRVGEVVRVRSYPHDIDEYMVVSQMELDMDNPENTTYVLGIVYDTLTGKTSSRLSSLNASLNKAYDEMGAIDETAKEAAKNADEANQKVDDALTKMGEFEMNIEKAISDIRDLVDGSIMTWFYPYPPENGKPPTDKWITDQDKEEHLGDLFYDTNTGYSYRWMVNPDGTYSWGRIEDSDVVKALAEAAKAKDVADSKRRVFFVEPYPPYDEGDIWCQGPDGDILVCEVPRTESEHFMEDDWTFASKYNKAVFETREEFYNSESEYNLVGGEWSQENIWEDGKFVWRRTLVFYGDGSTEYKPSEKGICISGNTGLRGLQGEQGEQGVPGPAGADGRTSYFHIKYSAVPNPTSPSEMSEDPDEYIGTCVDYNEKDPDSPFSYTWARFQGIQGEQGEKGIPGTNGIDGKTSYLHIAYANSEDGSKDFSVSDSVGKLYIGQYTDFKELDSNKYTDYSWTLIKGDKGDPGEQGTQGINLLRYTKDPRKAPAEYYSIESSSVVDYEVDSDGFTVINIKNDNTWNYANFYLPDYTIEEFIGKDVTISFWCKSDSLKSLPNYYHIYLALFNDANARQLYAGYALSYKDYYNVEDYKDGEWIYVRGHIKWPNISNLGAASGGTLEKSTKWGVQFYSNSSNASVATWSIKKPKLELGLVSDPTWTPAPEDLAGVGVTSVDIEYYLSSSNTVTQGGQWVTTPPAWRDGWYTWTRTIVRYTDGDSETTEPVCITGGVGATGAAGATGEAGKGVKSIVEEYYQSTSSTTQTGGSWSTTVPTWASGKYIWTRSKITYTDGQSVTTSPVCVTGEKGATGPKGDPGASGVGISAVKEYYLASSAASGVTTSTGGWKDTMQTMTTTNKYLWNYEEIVYTDGSTHKTTPVVIGVYGNTGGTGAAGKGISSITEYYLASTAASGVTTSTSGWTTTVPTITATNKYLWNYEKITYTTGDPTTTTPVIIGVYGDKGAKGDKGDTGAQGTQGINLVANSDYVFSNTDYPCATYLLTEPFKINEQYTISVWGTLGTGKTDFRCYVGGGSYALCTLTKVSDGYYRGTGKITTAAADGLLFINIYPFTSAQTGITSTINKVKLEKGNITDTSWTPAQSRGAGILKVTTAPTAYTTATKGFTPAFRMSLATVKTQSKSDYVVIGDIIEYSYNHYQVGYVDGSYVYTGAATSIRGATGGTGATGERGNSILKITTAPTAYTTATGGFTPAFRISLATVTSQSKAAKVLVGDVLEYSYNHYQVGYVDASYVYTGAATSIRGATGATGAAGTQGINLQRGSENWALVAFNNGSKGTSTIANGELTVTKGATNVETHFIPVRKDEVYTVSLDIKSATAYTGNTILIEFFNASGTRLFNKWMTGTVATTYGARFVYTFTVAASGFSVENSGTIENVTQMRIGLRAYSYDNTYKLLKIEKGSVANPVWTPAPQDLDGQMLYATCPTAAGTAAKVATLKAGTLTLDYGATVAVTFTAANTAASPTLNVSSTGAKAIRTNGVAYCYWSANETVIFTYDGTYWQAASSPVYANTAIIGNSAGQNVYIDGSSVNIRKGSTQLARFTESLIELGKNSSDSVISMAQDALQIGVTRQNGYGAYLKLGRGDDPSAWVDNQGVPIPLTISGNTMEPGMMGYPDGAARIELYPTFIDIFAPLGIDLRSYNGALDEAAPILSNKHGIENASWMLYRASTEDQVFSGNQSFNPLTIDTFMGPTDITQYLSFAGKYTGSKPGKGVIRFEKEGLWEITAKANMHLAYQSSTSGRVGVRVVKGSVPNASTSTTALILTNTLSAEGSLGITASEQFYTTTQGSCVAYAEQGGCITFGMYSNKKDVECNVGSAYYQSNITLRYLGPRDNSDLTNSSVHPYIK